VAIIQSPSGAMAPAQNRRRRCLMHFLTSCTALYTGGCSDATVPDDAQVSVIVTPATMARNGSPSTVSVLLLDADGEPIQGSGKIALSTTLGTVCPMHSSGSTCAEGDSAATIVVDDHPDGVVRALLFPGDATGSGTVTVTAGITAAAASITVRGVLLPSDATLELLAAPPSVSGSGLVRLHALAKLKDGTAAADGSLIVFSAARGILTVRAVLSEGGVAVADVRETPESLPDTVIASSGVLSDTVVLSGTEAN
jgi:hypothetical protein